MIVRSMIWSLSIKSLRTLEPPHTRKFPRVNAQDSKLGPIQPWDVKDFLGLRRIEWVIFGLKTRETWGLRGDFAFYGIWNLSMTDGWHEHRNVDGGFGIHIRFLVFDLNRQCAAFLVTRKRA
jgi:hypothetical protein